ncbi:MAG: hypothetical protein ABWZ91_06870 [Nocardioides sp.]
MRSPHARNLATILAADNSHEQSARLFRAGIALRHELGDEAGLAECFEGLAASLRAMSRHDASVTLLGASDALRTSTASLPSAGDKRLVQRLDASERAELGQQRFEENWQRGQRMSLDEIVDFATGSDATRVGAV